MAQRRQIRVSRSLEGGGERPTKRYGVTPSRRWQAEEYQPNRYPTDRLKPVLQPNRYFAPNLYAVFFGSKSSSVKPLFVFTFM
jgi:hypothetical protein